MQHQAEDEPSDEEASDRSLHQLQGSEARVVYQQRIAQLKQSLRARSQRRYSVEPDKTGISATVDGTGKLLALKIPDVCLRQAQPQLIGAEIFSAIQAARAEAVREESKVQPNVFE